MWVVGGFCGYGGSVWVMGEWAVGQWIVGVTSFQKIFGLCGLKCHIVEIWRDVTLVDDGQRTECEDSARILETEFAIVKEVMTCDVSPVAMFFLSLQPNFSSYSTMMIHLSLKCYIFTFFSNSNPQFPPRNSLSG